MNAHNPELIRQHQAHIARQARFNKPPAVRKPIAEDRKVYVRHMLPQVPAWKQKDIRFDAHCVTWKYDRAMFESPSGHIKRRSDGFGIPYSMMVGETRMVEIVIRRQLLVWELKRMFGMSFPSIGRLLGGRDHTTALHAYRKIDAMTDAERAAIDTPVSPKGIRPR